MMSLMDRPRDTQTKPLMSSNESRIMAEDVKSHLCLVLSNAHCKLTPLMFGRLGLHLNFGVAHAKIPDSRTTITIIRSLFQDNLDELVPDTTGLLTSRTTSLRRLRLSHV